MALGEVSAAPSMDDALQTPKGGAGYAVRSMHVVLRKQHLGREESHATGCSTNNEGGSVDYGGVMVNRNPTQHWPLEGHNSSATHSLTSEKAAIHVDASPPTCSTEALSQE